MPLVRATRPDVPRPVARHRRAAGRDAARPPRGQPGDVVLRRRAAARRARRVLLYDLRGHGKSERPASGYDLGDDGRRSRRAPRAPLRRRAGDPRRAQLGRARPRSASRSAGPSGSAASSSSRRRFRRRSSPSSRRSSGSPRRRWPAPSPSRSAARSSAGAAPRRRSPGSSSASPPTRRSCRTSPPRPTSPTTRSRRLAAPALLVYGESSSCRPTGDRLARVLPDAKLRVLPGGHFLPTDAGPRSPPRSSRISMADVVCRGVRLHVQRLGAPDRPVTAVFLHGLVMDNLSSWYFTVANPAAQRRRRRPLRSARPRQERASARRLHSSPTWSLISTRSSTRSASIARSSSSATASAACSRWSSPSPPRARRRRRPGRRPPRRRRLRRRDGEHALRSRARSATG